MNGKDARGCQRLVSQRHLAETDTHTTDDAGVALNRSPDWNHARDVSEVTFSIEEDDVSQPDK